MKTERIKINNIPAIIWGEKSKKVYIAVHGNMSNKEDEVIKILAEKAEDFYYQVLSFDLPEHGERKDEGTICNPINAIYDLKEILNYAKENYKEIRLWACSMGAYFSMLAYKDEEIKKALFLSPIIDMKVIIDNMMKFANVTEDMLKEKKEIKTEFGPTLYWDYYEYVKTHPIEEWNISTDILYGDKDNIQEKAIIMDFISNNIKSDLCTLECGEHYFHTEEQLDFYKYWLGEAL